MANARPTVVVTGISGDLGSRLAPLLDDFQVVGIDWKQPGTTLPFRFLNMNLEREDCCREIMLLLRETRASAFIHLASVGAHNQGEIMDADRMWQINVAGTARMLEAITEANREEMLVKKFIFPSSTLVYGPNHSAEASEESDPPQDLPVYVRQQIETEKVIRKRGTGLRACSIYMLRSTAFAGANSHNYLVSAFRPNRKGKRLPFIVPWGSHPLEKHAQFVHVDDMARLISYITHKIEPEPQRITLLNVTGRGDAITYRQMLEMAHLKKRALPGKALAEYWLTMRWNRGVSPIPPELIPYIFDESLINTARLRRFLGVDYEAVIHHSIADAFADSFSGTGQLAGAEASVAGR